MLGVRAFVPPRGRTASTTGTPTHRRAGYTRASVGLDSPALEGLEQPGPSGVLAERVAGEALADPVREVAGEVGELLGDLTVEQVGEVGVQQVRRRLAGVGRHGVEEDLEL